MKPVILACDAFDMETSHKSLHITNNCQLTAATALYLKFSRPIFVVFVRLVQGAAGAARKKKGRIAANYIFDFRRREKIALNFCCVYFTKLALFLYNINT